MHEEDSDKDDPIVAHASSRWARRAKRITTAEELSAKEVVEIQRYATAATKNIDVCLESAEWGETIDSDEEDQCQVVATASFTRRESRLQAQGLQCQGVSDVQVPLKSQRSEWAHAEDSDDEVCEVVRVASDSFKRRETRLVRGHDLVQRGSVSDVQVALVQHSAEWAQAGISDSEDDDSGHMVQAASFKQREVRLQSIKRVIDDDQQLLLDAKVELIQQGTEWENAGEESEEEGIHQATECFKRRETRLELGASARNELKISDVQVPLTQQDSEWAHADDSDSDDNCHIYAARSFKQRESRLQAACAVGPQIIITEPVQVMIQSTEWAHTGESDDDDLPAVVATESFKRRESRLGQNRDSFEAKDPTSACRGDQKSIPTPSPKLVPVGRTAARTDDSDEETGDIPMQKIASDSFSRREVRILARQSLPCDQIIPDYELSLKTSKSEWQDTVDSDDEEFNLEVRHASLLFERREFRLELQAKALEGGATMCDAEVNVRKLDSEWACASHLSDSDDAEEIGFGPTMKRLHTEAHQRRESRLRSSLQ